MESEYIAISDASLEAKYFLQIVNQVLPSIQHVNLYTDNEAARKVVEGNGQIRKIKHLHTGYHLARQMVIEGLIHIDWIPSSANTADILTKHIGSMKLFSKHRSEMVHESGNSW
jgi:Na+/phosphate symporter